MTPTELYILIGFLGFMSLTLVALLGFVVRLAISVGNIQGQINGLSERIGDLNERIGDLNERINGLERRIERLEEQMAALGREVGEIKGMLLGLNSRIDLLMAHHHDADGRVVIVPEEAPAADD